VTKISIKQHACVCKILTIKLLKHQHIERSEDRKRQSQTRKKDKTKDKERTSREKQITSNIQK
jgi:hypothetical protein